MQVTSAKNSFRPGIDSRPGRPGLSRIFFASCRFLITFCPTRCVLSLSESICVLLLCDPSLSDVLRPSPSCCLSICPLLRTILVRHIVSLLSDILRRIFLLARPLKTILCRMLNHFYCKHFNLSKPMYKRNKSNTYNYNQHINQTNEIHITKTQSLQYTNTEIFPPKKKTYTTNHTFHYPHSRNTHISSRSDVQRRALLFLHTTQHPKTTIQNKHRPYSYASITEKRKSSKRKSGQAEKLKNKKNRKT